MILRQRWREGEEVGPHGFLPSGERKESPHPTAGAILLALTREPVACASQALLRLIKLGCRCAMRYEDLAHLAHVSISIPKRVLKKLAHRNLVHVEWQAKHASLFTVYVCPLAPSPAIDLGLSPKFYDYFTEETIPKWGAISDHEPLAIRVFSIPQQPRAYSQTYFAPGLECSLQEAPF